MSEIFNTVNNSNYWDDKYNTENDGWTLNSPNPVFYQLLNEKKYVIPGKILVLGSGKGFDALAAAKAGFNVTAVDFSEAANVSSKKLFEENGVAVELLTEDIFNLPEKFSNAFDYVYDYTTYCAISPLRRKEFLSEISKLLKPEGKLIAHLFPVEKKDGGPPFGIDLLEFYNFASEFFNLVISTKQIPSIKPRAGREVLQIYRKK